MGVRLRCVPERTHPDQIIVLQASSPVSAYLLPFAEPRRRGRDGQRLESWEHPRVFPVLSKEARMSRSTVRVTRIAMGMSAVLRDLTTPLRLDPFGGDDSMPQFSDGHYWYQEAAEDRRPERR